MYVLGDSHKIILEKYARPIVHMRKQIASKRFGLVLGSGFSKDFGIPNWNELVDRLAQDREVDGQELLTVVPPHSGMPYRTEMLFEHFKKSRYELARQEQHHTRSLDFRISSDWKEIVRKHLYSSITANLKECVQNHPYLIKYIPLIRQSDMTVTYNFDDVLEQSLLILKPEDYLDSRGFESVTNPWTQFRRTNAVIYHPNGVIPQQAMETPSDRFVFSEASYAEQLMGIFAGDHAGLLSHFSKHTCLIIGLSLEDETFRNVLMHSARLCPGNFHYYVHYLKTGETIDDQKRHAITIANFKVYNLVTLFLNSEDISGLGELLDVEKCPTERFTDFACIHNIPTQFCYYVTGALGVGKSTTINYFRNLFVLDEWMEQRPRLLAKDWELLTSDEKESVDRWISAQFRIKNDVLRKPENKEGIFLMDRGPLDPLSFTPENEFAIKSKKLIDEYCPNKKWQIVDGKVLFLKGDSSELALRMLLTQRNDYTDEKLNKMEQRLSDIYGMEGVTPLDTRGMLACEVAKRVAEIVHLDSYSPTCDLNHRLLEFESKGTHA